MSLFVDIKITDLLIVLFTGLLVFVGRGQLRELRKTVAETAKAADAAKQSADAAEASIIPYLFPKVVTAQLLPVGIEAMYEASVNLPFPKLEYEFVNHGKSPAFVQEIRDKLIFEDELPDIPPLDSAPMVGVGTPVIPSDKSSVIYWCQLNRRLNPEEIEAIRGGGGKRFFLLIFVKYRDVFGSIINEQFCLKAMPPKFIHFEIRGSNAYNYRKRTKADG